MSDTIKAPAYITQHERWNSFLEFHLQNKHVFRKILKEIENGKNAGLKKISVKHIISHLRWDMQLLTKTNDFKINDGYTGIYTHLIIYNFPEYKDILTTKPLQALKRQGGPKEG